MYIGEHKDDSWKHRGTVSWFDLIKIQRHCRSAKLPLLDRRMHVLVDACIGVLCWPQDESPSNAGQKNITIGDVAPMDFLTLGSPISG